MLKNKNVCEMKLGKGEDPEIKNKELDFIVDTIRPS